MTTNIPHSLDAVIAALQAVIDGRPIPENWQTEAPAPVPTPAVVFDEVVLMQGICDLVDQKIAAIPVPQPIAVPAEAPTVPDLTQPLLDLGNAVDGLRQANDSRASEIETRLSAIESVLNGLSAAVHKDEGT